MISAYTSHRQQSGEFNISVLVVEVIHADLLLRNIETCHLLACLTQLQSHTYARHILEVTSLLLLMETVHSLDPQVKWYIVYHDDENILYTICHHTISNRIHGDYL